MIIRIVIQIDDGTEVVIDEKGLHMRDGLEVSLEDMQYISGACQMMDHQKLDRESEFEDGGNG